ncbi:MAG TPA: glycosyltransferase family 39 protein [Pyrinomonadaceae bacterium]|nr:glycosyltransferase family 39 protein [Pyrinomonadaceae bacterium]
MSVPADAQHLSSREFFRSYLYWLAPALLALVLALVYLNPFIGDWDGLDYTIFSLHGRPSSMALGRSAFTLFNFLLYQTAHAVFGLRPEQAYLLFKFVVVATTPLAVSACWILARDLSGSMRAATIAALLVACSPILVIYGGQVMTDVPSVLLSATALAIHHRGLKQQRVRLILAGAAVLGIGVNLRETVGFYLPWLIVAPFVAGFGFNRRTIGILAGSLAVFFVFAIGPFAVWFGASPSYRADWYVWLYSTQREAERHPIAFTNLRPFLIYFFLASPLVLVSLPFALWKEWRARGFTLVFTAAVVGLFATAMLFLNYSTTINWRYFLTGLPGLAPLAGDYFQRIQTKRFGTEQRGFVSAIIGIGLVAFFMAVLIQPKSNEYFNRLAQAKTYDAQLRLMPRDAVVIAGAQTVAVQYWRGIGLGEWDWIGVGAGWPQGQLESKITEHLKSGRRVFLDTDPRWWLPCSWHVSEIEELAKIDPHFHFKEVASGIYEIRPFEDQSAKDQPHLENLLPEKRPEEVKRCFDSG